MPELTTILALGADLKGAFAIAQDDSSEPARLFGPFGDLSEERNFDRWVGEIERRLDGRIPAIVVVDRHPLYHSRLWGRRFAEKVGARLLEVQHHFAHSLVPLEEAGYEGEKKREEGRKGESRLQPPFLGLIMDGTGYGLDGTIWGCEVLFVGKSISFERLGHLFPVTCPGGDAAAREPWRMAVSWARAAGIKKEELQDLAARIPAPFFDGVWNLAGTGRPLTTSAGRAFDAAAAFLDFALSTEGEAEAARSLQNAADGVETGERLSFSVEGKCLDLRPTFREMFEKKTRGSKQASLARAFHDALAGGVVELVAANAPREAKDVVLGGGCFLNGILRERIIGLLKERGFEVVVPRSGPSDISLPLGQVAFARMAFRSQRWKNNVK
ncbi:MAG: hypothetical protein D6679_06880 [Candidatus Hydrogenedentota bacterium]|nr:MAG: hypothetical protein D6679_06880 [Candidatus Hydrogenedentota bacterium]